MCIVRSHISSSFILLIFFPLTYYIYFLQIERILKILVHSFLLSKLKKESARTTSCVHFLFNFLPRESWFCKHSSSFKMAQKVQCILCHVTAFLSYYWMITVFFNTSWTLHLIYTSSFWDRKPSWTTYIFAPFHPLCSFYRGWSPNQVCLFFNY